jgi:hypothetical protein
LSIVALANRTAARQLTEPNTPEADKPIAKSKYVDILAALIPAEVVAAHAFIISQTVETKDADVEATTAKVNLQEVTDIENTTALQVAFVGLVIACPIIYAAAKAGSKAPWNRWDILRISIPTLAFVAWTMLTEPSVFDGFDQSKIGDKTQIVIGVLAALILGALAKLGQQKADDEAPPPAPPA